MSNVSNNIEDHTAASKKRIRDRILKIKEKMYKKGRYMVMDTKFNILLQSTGSLTASFRELCNENPKKYGSKDGKMYFVVKFTADPRYKVIFDKDLGGLKIHASILLVKFGKANPLAYEKIHKRNDKRGAKKESTCLWVRYRPSDIFKFKMHDTKRVAQSLYKAEHGPSIMEAIDYQKMKWARK